MTEVNRILQGNHKSKLIELLILAGQEKRFHSANLDSWLATCDTRRVLFFLKHRLLPVEASLRCGTIELLTE